MENIEDLSDRLFIATGLKYEALAYKKHRDLQRKSYNSGPFQKPISTEEELKNMAENEELEKYKRVMEHVAAIRSILKNGSKETNGGEIESGLADEEDTEQ